MYKGSDIIKKKVPYVTLMMFIVNFLLFTVKLYIGLSSNSISIYSDGFNNLFDSLTGIISFFMLLSLGGEKNPVSLYRTKKTEQLLTFVISVIVSISAFCFAYNSLERLTYPTPVTYSLKYFYVISFTAIVKILLFAVLKRISVSSHSAVIRLMSLDSLLDFFITSVTLITLALAKDGGYAVDAVCGIVISVIILVTAVKNLKVSVKKLTESVPAKKREKLEELLDGSDIRGISFDTGEEKSEIYIKIGQSEKEKLASLSEKIENQTDIKAYFIVCD